MRKIITLFLVTSLVWVGLSGCGVKRPLYEKPEQPPESQNQLNR